MDWEKAKHIGMEAYKAELREKMDILALLLELGSLRRIMAELTPEVVTKMTIKEKATLAADKLNTMT